MQDKTTQVIDINMKPYLTVIGLFFFFFNSSLCQVEDFISDAPGVFQMHFVGDSLLFAGIENNINYIGAADINVNDNSFLKILELDTIQIVGLGAHDNFIYYTLSQSGDVYRINLKSQVPEPEIIFSGHNRLLRMDIYEGFMYIIDFDQTTESSKILKFNLENSDLPSDTIISKDEFIREVHVNNNFLYYSSTDQTVSCVDLQTEPYVPEEFMPGPKYSINGLEVVDDELYMTEGLLTFYSFGSVLKASLEKTYNDTTIADITGGIPMDVEFHKGYLYISEFGFSITRFKIEENTVSTNRLEMSNIRIFPNPTSDYISILGVERPMKYSIIGSNGVTYSAGDITRDEDINVSDLPSGNYYVFLNRQSVGKFIKQE